MSQRAPYGSGSVREKRPGVWEVRVFVRGRQVSRTIRGTEAQARLAIPDLKRRIPRSRSRFPKEPEIKPEPVLQLGPFVGTGWMAKAICPSSGLKPSAFFPPKGGSSTAAKRVCARCPVRDACRDYAEREGIHHGVWGGRAMYPRRSSR